jgi:hypothetical protein
VPRAPYAKQLLRDKLLDHKAWIEKHGEDMPEIQIGSGRMNKLIEFGGGSAIELLVYACADGHEQHCLRGRVDRSRLCRF